MSPYRDSQWCEISHPPIELSCTPADMVHILRNHVDAESGAETEVLTAVLHLVEDREAVSPRRETEVSCVRLAYYGVLIGGTSVYGRGRFIREGMFRINHRYLHSYCDSVLRYGLGYVH